MDLTEDQIDELILVAMLSNKVIYATNRFDKKVKFKFVGNDKWQVSVFSANDYLTGWYRLGSLRSTKDLSRRMNEYYNILVDKDQED